MQTKEVLAEFIFLLDKSYSFSLGSSLWSSPVKGFSHNNSLPSKFMKELKKSNLLSEGIDNVICVLGDWESVAEGIIFTDRAIYVNSPKNKDKKFKVRYDEIKSLIYVPPFRDEKPTLGIETTKDYFIINTALWSKRDIHDFLQFACEKYEFDDENREKIAHMHLEKASGVEVGSIAAGIVYGNISNASSYYFDDKILTPKGHGFAAEHANHLADIYQGKKAQIVGDNNAKNGADRLVDGVYIQSKYCSSGSKCVQECFDNGTFRYWNPDGTPMQIEVPSDMYEAAIQAMENRIQKGEVPGVTNPAEAKNIIKKGNFTYLQAKNIAKAGTVESICYDAASGAIIARNSMGITAVLTFAVALWNGEKIDVALKSAVAQGLKVYGTTFVTAVLAGQLSKAGLNSALVGSSEAIVSIMGPKASAVLVNAFRSGTNIYGAAAMKSAAKLFRSNVITGIISFAVLSIGDVGNIFQGRISGGQLFKNLTNTASTVVGGGLGWTAGAAAGATLGSIIPGVGTAIGGFVGGLVGAFGGGSISSKAANAVLDQFIEDDADKMVEIIQEVFTSLAEEYLTTQKEAEDIVSLLQSKLTGSMLKDMFASPDRKEFAYELLNEYFKDTSYNRRHITLPSDDEMKQSLKRVLEDIADESLDLVMA